MLDLVVAAGKKWRENGSFYCYELCFHFSVTVARYMRVHWVIYLLKNWRFQKEPGKPFVMVKDK